MRADHEHDHHEHKHDQRTSITKRHGVLVVWLVGFRFTLLTMTL